MSAAELLVQALADRDQARADRLRLEQQRDEARAESDNANVARESEWKRAQAAEKALDAERSAHADTRAQLAKVRRDRDEAIRVHDEVEADRDALREEVARLQDVATERFNSARTAQADLGRAVDLLQDARDAIAVIYRRIDEDREIKAMKACKPICDKIDAFLVPIAAAGESWRTLEAEHEEAMRLLRVHDGHGSAWVVSVNELIAKVDARRGGGR